MSYGPVQFATTFAQFLKKRNLQHMIVHVTNHCNFRCEHCFVDFTESKKDLKLEAYETLSRDAGPLFWLDIAGGEPFLRRDLAEIVCTFDTKVVQIPSNGSLPELMIKQLKQMQDHSSAEITVSLSLDGLRDTHDTIRKAPGNYDQVWDTFQQLRDLGGVSIKVNSCLHKDNVEEILELMREVRKHEPDFHSIILLRGDPLNPEYALPPLDELREIGRRIFAILETYDYGKNGFSARMLRNYHRYLWNISLATLKEKTQVIPCLAGQAHMVVWGDGRVSSCEMLPSIGNIQDQSWSEIMESDAFAEQVQFIKDKKCHCTHNCAMFDSIMFRPQSIPSLIHQTVA